MRAIDSVQTVDAKKVKLLLDAWGAWSSGKIGTEYRSESVVIAGAPISGNIRPYITDKEAMVIDQAVGSLKFFDNLAYYMVMSHYRSPRLSCRSIARSLNKRPDYVTAYISRAEAYIAGKINDRLC